MTSDKEGKKMKIKCEVEANIVWVLTIRIVKKHPKHGVIGSDIGGTERVYLFKETAYEEWRDVVRLSFWESQPPSFWKGKESIFESYLDDFYRSGVEFREWTYEGEASVVQVRLLPREICGNENSNVFE